MFPAISFNQFSTISTDPDMVKAQVSMGISVHLVQWLIKKLAQQNPHCAAMHANQDLLIRLLTL